jgi:hypothetical protein
MDGAHAPMGSDREEATATTKGNSRSLRDDNQKNKRNCRGKCNSEGTATATATATAKELQQRRNCNSNGNCEATATAKQLQQRSNCNSEATATAKQLQQRSNCNSQGNCNSEATATATATALRLGETRKSVNYSAHDLPYYRGGFGSESPNACSARS